MRCRLFSANFLLVFLVLAPFQERAVAQGATAFLTAQTFSLGGTDSGSMAVADFNGDGKLDVVTTNIYPPSVSVLLGKGNGTFRAAVIYSVESALGSNDVSVLLGNGDGTLRPAVNYTVGSGPSSVAVGDFNGDGKLDLAVANSDDTNVSVLLGNGDGTFRSAVNYTTGLLTRKRSPSATLAATAGWTWLSQE